MADYVDRRRLKEAISADCQHLSVFDTNLYELVMLDIDEIPTADVRENVQGYWDDVFQDGPCSWSGRCSVCGVRNDIPPLILAHFCPNCGAQMGGNKNG